MKKRYCYKGGFMYIGEKFKNKTLFREITGVKFEIHLKIVSEYRKWCIYQLYSNKGLVIYGTPVIY